MYIDRITDNYPNWTLKFHIIQDLNIDSALYHEIGHHIHYKAIGVRRKNHED